MKITNLTTSLPNPYEIPELPRSYFEPLSLLNSVLNFGVMIFSQQLSLEYVSEKFCSLLSVSPEYFDLDNSFANLQKQLSAMGVILPDILPYGKDHKVEAQSGRTLKLRYVLLENGSTICLIEDISRLLEKDKLLEDALALSGSGYWIYDLETKDMVVSKSLEIYFSREQLKTIKAEGPQGLALDADKDTFRKLMDTALKSKGRFKFDAYSQNHLGEHRRSRTWGDIIRDETGKPVKIKAFVKDITKTHDFNIALEDARNNALMASRAKSEFLAMISHEVRTPMNSILGMSEILSKSDIPAPLRTPFHIIQSSAEKLMRILNDILDFSKIESGDIKLVEAPFNLRTLVQNVVELSRPKADEKHLNITIDYDCKHRENFVGDAVRLHQILSNLVSNAVKFTHQGSVDISVTVADIKFDRSVIKLMVTDTGIGIAPDKLDYIFDKFTQSDSSTSRPYGGTGLGLAICKNLVELMQGRIRVESTPKQGSTFSFALALSRGKNIDISPAIDHEFMAKEQSAESDKAGALPIFEILIADDVKLNRELMKTWLMGSRYSPVFVENGHQAVDVFTKDPKRFRAVLMDISMPVMNGFKAAEQIHLLQNESAMMRVPIIAVTAHDFQDEAMNHKGHTICDFLSKPISRDGLLAKLDTWTDHGDVRAQIELEDVAIALPD